MGTLTIRLDDKLDRELARLAKRAGRPKSELAREALRKQLALQRFRKLRRQAMPYAEAAGYLTEGCRSSPHDNYGKNLRGLPDGLKADQ